MDRTGELRGKSMAGASFVVVGSQAAGLFKIARSARIGGVLCESGRPAKTKVYFLRGPGRKGVGAPLVGIRVSSSDRFDPRAARFYRLDNRVSENLYRELGDALKQTVVAEAGKGEFRMLEGDGAGRAFLRSPAADGILLKLDFAAPIPIQGASKAMILVDGVQVSKSFRRCMRLSIGGRPAGNCAEMPHGLMAETNLLRFIAYDPNGDNHPFILAYTPEAPLWGHERWGFRLTRKGPSRFLMDALDPKCREGF